MDQEISRYMVNYYKIVPIWNVYDVRPTRITPISYFLLSLLPWYVKNRFNGYLVKKNFYFREKYLDKFIYNPLEMDKSSYYTKAKGEKEITQEILNEFGKQLEDSTKQTEDIKSKKLVRKKGETEIYSEVNNALEDQISSLNETLEELRRSV